MALKRKFSPVNNFVLVSPAADASPQHTQAPEYVLDVTAPSHVLISRFQGSIILIFGWRKTFAVALEPFYSDKLIPQMLVILFVHTLSRRSAPTSSQVH